MTIYNLTVLADPTLNGRSSPSSASSSNIIFPNGFKKNDICKANQISVVGSITWYGIYECVRAGVKVILPASVVWAASTGTNSSGILVNYLRLDSTITDPIPPVSTFPSEVWLSMTETGERRKYVLV